MYKIVRLRGTTSAGGALTVTAPASIEGYLYAVIYDIGSFAAGVDVTISTVNSDAAQTHLTLTDANASATYYPRLAACGATGSAETALTVLPPVLGQLKMVVAQGGNAKTGGVTCLIVEE